MVTVPLRSKRGRTVVGLIIAVIAILATGRLIYVRYFAPRASFSNLTCGTLNLSAENGAQFFLQQPDYKTFKDCFYNAYTNHQQASIALHMMGVDTGSTTVYLTDGSAISDQVQSYSANFGGSQHTGTGTCTSMAERLGGIIMVCSDGDVLYSPSNSSLIPYDQI